MSPAPQSAALRSFEEQWRARAPDALSGLRERALNRFLQLGLPTSHDESWRYTSLRPLASQSFVDAPGPDSPRAAAPGTASGGLDRRRALALPAAQALLGGRAAAEAHAIVLVNGYPLLPPALDAGLQVRALSALARDNPDLLVRDLEPLSDAEELRWLLLNTALGVDGVHIKIMNALATPLLILHVGSADRPGTVAYPRVIIETAPGAAGTVIEHHIQDGAAAPLSNSATLLDLERDARIEHYRVFAAGERAVHFDTLQVRLRRNAECRQFTVAVGGGLVRTSLDARLSEPGAKLDSRALLVGHAERHVDCVNVVRHAAASTVSRQTARAIASGTSRVIFNSKVVVDAGASQSDSQQSCRGLLLSPTAEIDSRPQLEIHTDEVKCAHGATTGRLDPNMLFYMLSRGLDRETAQSLLVYAFLADVLTDMSEVAARTAIENELIRQLPRFPKTRRIPMNTAFAPTPPAFDVDAIRREFPILGRTVHGKPLAYLDSGASAQRPRSVIAAVDDYERLHHANIHRGVHTLSQEATALYEGARERIARFINARSAREIVFVRGTTEAINLVAQSYGRPLLEPGDEVLITHLEHHANIVPWQMLCEQTGAKLVVAPIDARGEVHAEAVEALMSERTRLLAFAHISNALGTILPVRRLIAAARTRGITTLIDGAQAVPHLEVDVQELGCDFYTFSGHKMFASTGVGVLYGRESLLERMPPWQGGGDMILTVSFGKTVYNGLPHKFEAGTPNISGVVGLGAAVDFMQSLDRQSVHAHEQGLLEHATHALGAIEGLRIIGTARDKASLISFVVEGVHPHDLGTILDGDGIAIRTGHHCAMPVMDFFEVPATARASFALYNTFDEIDRLAESVGRARALIA